MTTGDTAIFVANLVMVILAVAANVVATLDDDPRQRPMWASIAALGVLYVAGYIWVLNTGDPVTWSKLFRGVSIAAWPIVWIVPPVRSVLMRRRDLARMREKAHHVRRSVER
jgi:hypothetical protein